MPAYKQLCIRCKKKYVLMKSRYQRPVCLECEMKDLFEPIDDPKMAKMFDIPKNLYEESNFLRDIRYKYNMLGFLSERQEAAFKKVSKEMQDPKKKAAWEKKIKEKEEKRKEKEKKKSANRLTPDEKKMLGLE